MRVLIADDEAPARDRLRQLLAAHRDVEVIGEAENGAEAVRLAASLRPDLMLLDIQMPGASGLDVAACLPRPRPAIIFCTAFEQHAVDAFELNAIDYLLKPVTRARLAESLQRVTSAAPMASPEKEQPSAVPLGYLSRFIVRSGSHYVVVPVQDAAFLESVDGLTRVTMTDGQVYWIDPSLQELETQIDPSVFFRISRNAIVALRQVSEVHPLPGGAAELLLRRGARLEVSRRRLRALLTVLAKA